MKGYSKIFFLIFIIGCHPDNQLRIGRYKSVEFNKLEWYWLYYKRGITSAVVGDELNLYSDSTFFKTSCGSIVIGTWYTRNDSIFFINKNVQYRNDSLRRFREPQVIHKEPYGFKIKNNTLEAIWNYGNGKRTISKLKLNVP
jgi:hypothetical protein